MGRILAIDYGTKRCGVAVSDPMRIIAGSLDTVPTRELGGWLSEYLSAEAVTTIVVGRPVKMDATPSDTYRAAGKLVERLTEAYPGIEVVWYDERFTSVMAQRAMIDGGLSRMKRRDKALVDKVSATIILQGYMESLTYGNRE